MSGVEKTMPQRMADPKQESIFGRGAGGTSLRMHHQRWKDPPCYQWVNPLFLWSMVSIAMLNYQKGQSTDVQTAMLEKTAMKHQINTRICSGFNTGGSADMSDIAMTQT